MFAQPVDGDWHPVADAIAPIRFARFMAGFAAVLAAMAVVGAMFYLAVFTLAGAVSFGEAGPSVEAVPNDAVAGAPEVGH